MSGRQVDANRRKMPGEDHDFRQPLFVAMMHTREDIAIGAISLSEDVTLPLPDGRTLSSPHAEGDAKTTHAHAARRLVDVDMFNACATYRRYANIY